MEFRPPLDLTFGPHAVTALVTAPGDVPVEASVMREPPMTGGLGIKADPAVVDTHPRFAFRRDEIAAVPNGTMFTILEGPDAGTWRVDRTDATVDDEVISVVATRRS